MRIVLFQPQIPQNTGNIVRTCSVVGVPLTLITPMGFSPTARQLRRAGLDYWEGVDVSMEDDLRACIKKEKGKPYFFTSHATTRFDTVAYQPDDFLVFGSESHGLPDWIHEQYSEQCVTIPMKPETRCLNLATSVGIGVYEAWRQNSYKWQL